MVWVFLFVCVFYSILCIYMKQGFAYTGFSAIFLWRARVTEEKIWSINYQTTESIYLASTNWYLEPCNSF